MPNPSKAEFTSTGFSKTVSPATTLHYVHGQLIFAQGDAADAMFYIQKGSVKLSMTSKKNIKSAIAILGAGDCFGEGCLFPNVMRTYSASSIHRSTIQRVSRYDMILRLRNEPAFAELFMAHLLLRVGRIEDDMADHLTNSSERRLARLLLQLSGIDKKSKNRSVHLKIDQATLAEVIGTTRARVSYFMNQFRKKGFIDYNGSLKVHKELQTFLSNNNSQPAP